MSVVLITRCEACGHRDSMPLEDLIEVGPAEGEDPADPAVADALDGEAIDAFNALAETISAKHGPRPCPACERPGVIFETQKQPRQNVSA
jgi:hypothetical protein